MFEYLKNPLCLSVILSVGWSARIKTHLQSWAGLSLQKEEQCFYLPEIHLPACLPPLPLLAGKTPVLGKKNLKIWPQIKIIATYPSVQLWLNSYCFLGSRLFLFSEHTLTWCSCCSRLNWLPVRETFQKRSTAVRVLLQVYFFKVSIIGLQFYFLFFTSSFYFLPTSIVCPTLTVSTEALFPNLSLCLYGSVYSVMAVGYVHVPLLLPSCPVPSLFLLKCIFLQTFFGISYNQPAVLLLYYFYVYFLFLYSFTPWLSVCSVVYIWVCLRNFPK